MNAFDLGYLLFQRRRFCYWATIFAKDRDMGRVRQKAAAKFIAKSAADGECDNKAGNARSNANDRDDRGEQGKAAAAGKKRTAKQFQLELH